MGTWGGANRPVTSNKLGIPTKAEGADGALHIRQTQLGTLLQYIQGLQLHLLVVLIHQVQETLLFSLMVLILVYMQKSFI